jgi:uncharacterized protein (TIGR00369 family)
MTVKIPEGFEPCQLKDNFSELVGTFYQKGPLADAVFGMVLDQRHGNLNGVTHGGALFTFADSFMGMHLEANSKRLTATISLNVDFVSGMAADGWIEGRARMVRQARTIAFLQGEITCGGEVLMTADGVWRVFKEPSPRV